MQITTTAKYVRVSPRKLRLVADLVKNLSAKRAIEELAMINKKAAVPLKKVIKTAVADAINNFNCQEENLVIKTIDIGKGPVFKRWRAVARGRVHPYVKRTSHIKVVLEEKENEKKE